jgi:hypothetical protein
MYKISSFMPSDNFVHSVRKFFSLVQGFHCLALKSRWSPFILPVSFLLLTGILLFKPATVYAQASTPLTNTLSAGDLCTTATTIPQDECRALVSFYQSTDGPHWINQNHWLTIDATISPCDWFGVVCENGHVTQLTLSHNGLRSVASGDSTIHKLSHLSQLTTLLLANNQLSGNVPQRICELTKSVTVADFAFNQLSANNLTVAHCLNQLDPDWAASQITPPTGLHVTAITTDSLELQWTPIRYSQGAGDYEISYATSLDGPFTLHGHTLDKQVNRYLLNHLTPGQSYTILVRTYSPVQGDQQVEQRSEPARAVVATQASSGQVLLIVYFAGDNDLSPYAASILRRLQHGTALNPNVQVVALFDQAGDHNTAVFELNNGTRQQTDAVQTAWGSDELVTTDPQALTWFLQYARNRYPNASRTIVALIGHGAGLTPEVLPSTVMAANKTAPQSAPVPALPRHSDFTPGDVSDDGGYLSTLDYAQALSAATDNGARPFDLLFFDQCFQGNLDVLYQVHQTANILIASPNYAWLAAPYDKYLPLFTPDAPLEQTATAITRIYEAALTDSEPNAIFWVHGADLPVIASAVSDLGAALHSAISAGVDQRILNAARNSQSVDTTDCGRGNMKLGPPDELIGAGSFARNLQERFLANDNFGIYSAAGAVLNTLNTVHTLARVGKPYLVPPSANIVWDYTDSLTILAPLHRDAAPAVAWRATIYGEQSPLTARWSADPGTTVVISTTFAFARDGQWDNFLADWYTSPMTPTVGMWCDYMPPIGARENLSDTTDVTETLALTVTPTGETLDFAWSTTSNDAATEYWLMVRQPGSYNWLVQTSLPLTQTSYAVQKPETNTPYEFRVIAQDEAGAAVALSNQVAYAALPPTQEQRTYLPLVQR